MVSGLDPTLGVTAATAITFTIGLLLGIVAKRTLKLVFAIASLVILLAVTGYVNFSLSEVTSGAILRAFYNAPSTVGQVSEIAGLLPFSSAAFMIGMALGIWKG